MWTLFKIINFIWLLTSTYAWFTTTLPLTPIIFLVNVVMAVCLGMLPIRISFDARIGRILLAILAVMLWITWCDGYVMGIFVFMTYLPAVMLILLPVDYQKDLLRFVTKWYSIMVGIGLLEYLAALAVNIPSLGTFTHPVYVPFTNYGFYIKTTYDTGFITRFNAFFLEPGHQALASTFLLLANRFDFRRVPYCYILMLAVICSFSLAGYLLTFLGLTLLWVNNIRRFSVVAVLIGAIVGGAVIWNGGDNDLNALIVSRLEYDQDKGIKGNNRFYNNTDFEFERAQKNGRAIAGAKKFINMELVNGAGFKIYVLQYGWIGVALVALLYLSMIPPRCNVRYTIAFLAVLVLCFIQRAYPNWYSWLLPYILGTYTNRRIAPDEDARNELQDIQAS